MVLPSHDTRRIQRNISKTTTATGNSSSGVAIASNCSLCTGEPPLPPIGLSGIADFLSGGAFGAEGDHDRVIRGTHYEDGGIKPVQDVSWGDRRYPALLPSIPVDGTSQLFYSQLHGLGAVHLPGQPTSRVRVSPATGSKYAISVPPFSPLADQPFHPPSS